MHHRGTDRFSVAVVTRQETGPAGQDFHCVEPALSFFAIATATEDAGGWVAARASLRACRQSLAETGRHDPMDGTGGRSLLPQAGRKRLEDALLAAHGTVSVWQGVPEIALGAVLFQTPLAWAAVVRECGVYMARDGQLRSVGTAGVPEMVDVRCGDQWLLCSAGGHPGLSAGEIGAVLNAGNQTHPTLDSHVRALAAACGEDVTATLVILEILEAS